MSRPVLIVKTGRTMPDLAARRGDYEDWISAGVGLGPIEVVDVEEGEALPDPATPRAVIVTGSSALVTERLAWSERTRAWLPEIVTRGTPLLGICYGHQLLADALGGEVAANPVGREIGSIAVTFTEEGARDPLFVGLPEVVRLSASHRQHVRQLPPGARHLAHNAADPHQAYAVGPRAWGVQFHPEWDHDVIRAYLEARREVLLAEGLDPDALLEEVAPSEHGPHILARFGELAG